jgi:NAD(P)H-dependent FMN reductase
MRIRRRHGLKLRPRISAADAVLFVTPKHNRSVPAALKNTLENSTLDWPSFRGQVRHVRHMLKALWP